MQIYPVTFLFYSKVLYSGRSMHHHFITQRLCISWKSACIRINASDVSPQLWSVWVCVCLVCVWCVFSVGGGFYCLLNIPAGQYIHIQTHGWHIPHKNLAKPRVFSSYNNHHSVTANTFKNNQVKQTENEIWSRYSQWKNQLTQRWLSRAHYFRIHWRWAMRRPITLDRVCAGYQWRGGMRRVLDAQKPMEGYGRLAAQTTGRLNSANTPTHEPIGARLGRGEGWSMSQ